MDSACRGFIGTSVSGNDLNADYWVDSVFGFILNWITKISDPPICGIIRSTGFSEKDYRLLNVSSYSNCRLQCNVGGSGRFNHHKIGARLMQIHANSCHCTWSWKILEYCGLLIMSREQNWPLTSETQAKFTPTRLSLVLPGWHILMNPMW
jgi:hypothetical protein